MPDLDPLSDLFPSPHMDAWRALIETQLRGADFERRLVHATDDGIKIQPLYTEAPAVPSARATTRGWQARVIHANPGVVAEHRAIVADLEQGADSVRIRVGGPLRNGVSLHRLSGMTRELDGIAWAQTALELEAGPPAVAAAAILAAYWQSHGVVPAPGTSLGLDPLGALSADGTTNGSLSGAWSRAAAVAVWLEGRGWPDVRALTLDMGVYHLAGASHAQDLGFALASGVEALRALTAAGLTVAQANERMAFTLDVGAEFFAGIAKLRAFRQLWRRVLQASGGEGSPHIQARPGGRMFTQRDPWVNLLRNTVGCFAGIVGGAEVVYTRPFDYALGRPDSMSRRIARNTLSVLRHESHLDAVLDPAGGSAFIESYTAELANKAWAVLQTVEQAGQMGQAIVDGLVHALIEPVAKARARRVATRKQPITGVSEFPNLSEANVARPDRVAVSPDVGNSPPGARAALDALRDASAQRFEAAIEAATAGATLGDLAAALAAPDGEVTTVVPLSTRPDAAPYEALRTASDAWLAKTGQRPRVFLAALGPVAHHTARMGWAANFFAAGGIEPIASEGFVSAQAASEAFAASGASMACICSSDRMYADLAAPTAQALTAAGARRVVLAGKPNKDWHAAGVQHFIHLGCDVLGTLTTLLTDEGVLS
jgi:methylmalonyl-CoA mutase